MFIFSIKCFFLPNLLIYSFNKNDGIPFFADAESYMQTIMCEIILQLEQTAKLDWIVEIVILAQHGASSIAHNFRANPSLAVNFLQIHLQHKSKLCINERLTLNTRTCSTHLSGCIYIVNARKQNLQFNVNWMMKCDGTEVEYRLPLINHCSRNFHQDFLLNRGGFTEVFPRGRFAQTYLHIFLYVYISKYVYTYKA